MIIIMLFVLVFLALFSGIGILIARRLEEPVPETLFASFFIGWGLTITALQIWHLGLPVGGVALAAAFLVALIGWTLAIRYLFDWLKMIPRSQVLVFCGLGLFLLYLITNQSFYSTVSYDHGLYHLPMVKWLQQYPIVPGLGNLHHRFAFNNSSFLVVAMMDNGPFKGLVYYTATTMLFAALIFRGLLAAHRLTQGVLALREAFYALMLPVSLWYVTSEMFSYVGYNTDLAVYFLQVVLAGELLRVFDRTESDGSSSKILPQALFVAFGAALGVTIKLSFAVFGLGIALATAIALLLRSVNAIKDRLREITRLLAVGGLVVVPWLLRGSLFSGYPFYPSTVIALPVPWKIPTAMAEPISGIITLWARHGGKLPADTPFVEWVDWWLPRQYFELKEAVLFTVLFIVIVIFFQFLLRAKISGALGPIVLLIVTAVSLVCWFVMAPSVRFASALPWMLPVIAGLLIIYQSREVTWLKSKNTIVALGMFLIMLWLLPAFTNNVSTAWLFKPPTESEIAVVDRINDPLRSQQTNSGLTVYLAAGANEELCFDQPLPCTRVNDFDPRLSLITPGDLRSGFWVDVP